MECRKSAVWWRRLVRRLPAMALVALAPLSGAAAQNLQLEPEIDTNRPTYTYSPYVVPPGRLQAENGFTAGGQSGTTGIDLPQTQLRLGMVKRTELSMFVPDYWLVTGGRQRISGVAGIVPGAKVQIGPFKNDFRLGAIGQLRLPTGISPLYGNTVNPQFLFPWAVPLKKGFNLAGQLGLFYPTINSRRDFTIAPNLVLHHPIGEKAHLWMEYASFYYQHGKPTEILHFGGAYKVRRNQQIDFHFGFGLTNASPSAFVGAGYSFFVKVPRL